MSKGAKIGITIGVVLFLAIILSIRDLIDSEAGIVILSIINLAGLFFVIWIWSKKDDNKMEKGEDVVPPTQSKNGQIVIKPKADKDIPFTATDNDEKEKKEVTPIKETVMKPSIRSDIPYEQQLLEALRKACFPKNFMDPYDPDKVSIANELYQKLQAQDLSSEDIYSIRDRAIKELGITIDASFLFEELSAVCNPVNYMDPYDAEMVEVANRLYNRVLENKGNIVELEKIRSEGIEKGLIINNDEELLNTTILLNNDNAEEKSTTLELKSVGKSEVEKEIWVWAILIIVVIVGLALLEILSTIY